MRNFRKVSKRITSTLGILVILLGLVPLPFVNSVTTAFAEDNLPPTEDPAPDSGTVSEPVVSKTSPSDESTSTEEVQDSSTLTEEVVLLEDALPTDEDQPSSLEGSVSVPEVDLSVVVETLAESGSVLADGSGEPISLTSNEAVNALIVADPYFDRGGDRYCYIPLGDLASPSLHCDFVYNVASPIQSAVDDVTANGLPDDGIITVLPGTYEENVVINVSGLTLYGDPGSEYEDGADSGAAVLDGSSLNGTGITINADYVSIIGFILRNFDTGIYINEAGDVLIQDNTLEDNKVGIKVNNTSGSSKKVELYGNVVKSSETDSVGLNVLASGPNSIYGSLNSFMNESLNIKDESGRDDFELFFNEWGYFNGASYITCTISGHTDADYAGLFTCAQTENVLPKEMFLDGSILPYVFSQSINKNGEFCLDEKNYDYATRTESGGGPLTLSYGESLSFVAVKQATSCYYQSAPTADGPENGTYLAVNGVEQCIFVTRSTDPTSGEFSYLFEVVGDGPGCGLSHVVGYFDPIIDEEPECEGEQCVEQERYDLILDPYCGVDGQLVWEIINPNNFSVDADWTLDGSPASGTLAPGTTFVGYTPDGPSDHTLSVTWEFGEDSFTSSEVCAPPSTPPNTPPVLTVIEDLLIPVTGSDLGFAALVPFGGTLLLGISFLVKGITSKIKK